MPDQPDSLNPYDRPAGGISAVTSTLRHLLGARSLGRGVRALRVMNQTSGFDCPGCAWPEPEDRSAFEFCENGAKAVAAEATRERVGPSFFEEFSISALLDKSDHWLDRQGRLTHPVLRPAGSDRYQAVSWDDAFELAGEALRSLESPDQAAFYTSGRTSNEAAYLLQLFVRLWGTNNLPDCSNLCHESSGVGLTRSIGSGKGSVQLSDFERAEAIFVIGQNPGTNHPRMLNVLQRAARRGAKIVAINPLRERGLERFTDPQEPWNALLGRSTPIASHYLQPQPGSDVALLKGIMKHLLEHERAAPGTVLDHGFIQEHTTGIGSLIADLETTTWTEIERETGLSEASIRPVSEVYIRSPATIVCWAMGLTQHEHGVDNVISCANLLLLKGNIGRPGAGPCPVRGHSNVQGDRTMGITHRPPEEFLARLEERYGFQAPRRAGLDVVETIRAMGEAKIRFFLSLGGNFLSASPDTEATARALGTPGLSIYIATKLNRSHLVTGERAMIWPCLGRSERDRRAGGVQRVTVEDSMSSVHASQGRNRPASGQLLSEPAIVCRLAAATLPANPRADWAGWRESYDLIRDEIEAVIPGFERFNQRISKPGGFTLPHPASRREWKSKGGKAEFVPVPIPRHRLKPGELRLFTIRSHDQYNTTIYGLDDRYRGVRGERRVIFLHPDDMAERGIGPGDELEVRSRGRDGRELLATRFKAVPYDLPRGSAAAYFPEANVLVPLDRTAAGSNTPASKLVPVTVRCGSGKGG
ncbi:MAG: FdhF/YdeP family oxidoreductase [Longimicrobiaceae bacterium]